MVRKSMRNDSARHNHRRIRITLYTSSKTTNTRNNRRRNRKLSILDILLAILGIFVALIGIVAYKKRAQITDAVILRQQSKMALKEFEDKLYKEAYLQALQEELPKAMKEKALRDIQKKYNKTPLTEKFAKMAEEAQKQATINQKDHTN